jgi:TolB-like protein
LRLALTETPPLRLLAELKRRNVIRMAGLYLVGAWLIVQVAATLLPTFDAPAWVMKVLVALLAIGFLAAIVFSWLYELTPDGLKRDAEVDPAQSIAPQTARRMDRLIFAGLLALIAVIAADRYWPRAELPAAVPIAVSEPASTPADPTAPAAAIHPDSIAVLPFVDMSQAKDQEYFSDGLAEEILNLLAQIRDLKVIGRTSSFAFKGKNEDLRTIGNALGVAYLLEGSVRKAGDDLRITAQLIEVEGGSHLWSQSYDRKLENVFAIQTEIAASIAQALKINLVGPDQTAPVAQAAASLPAYELFLQARRLIQGRTRSGLEAARGLLDEALKLDPNYAPALAAQAQAIWLLNNLGGGYGDIPPEQATAMAQPLAERALALDPKLAEAHAVIGLILVNQRDFSGAEAALARALALNPNQTDALHWQAGRLGGAGRLREQLAVRQRLDAIDPLNVANLLVLNGALRNSGKLTEAQAVTARMQRAFPDNPQSFGAQANDLLDAGHLAEAQVPAARMLALKSNWAPQLNAGMYYLLGDFEKMLSFPGLPKAQPLLALGRLDEAVAAARERFAAAPEDRDAAQDLLRTLSWSGHFDELLTLYRERWSDLEALDTYFGPVEMGPLLSIATAQRAQGQQQDLADTLTHWRKRLDFLREQGRAGGQFLMTEARYLALAGERAAALAALTQAIDLGVRDPLLGRDPAFAELHDEPAFKAQLTRMTGLINIERAKLGMAPLP